MESATAPIINPYRKVSFGLHARIINQNNLKKLTIDKKWFESVSSIITAMIDDLPPVQSNELHQDFNKEYGVIILSDKDANKTFATDAMRKKYHNYKIIIIGDSKGDIVTTPGVEIWAVGNATEEIKNVATRIASKSFTEGVFELLK